MVTVNYKIYKDGYDFLGTTEHEAPTINSIIAEMKGGSIAGTVETPVKGLFQAMSMKLTFDDVTSHIYNILTPELHHIELWSAIQITDEKSGKLVIKQHKLIYRAIPKTNTIGKLAPGEFQGRSIDFSVQYFKEIFDGKDIIEIDQLNCIYRVNGKDENSDVRKSIGIL